MLRLGLNTVGLKNRAYLGSTLVFDPTPNPIPQDDLIVDLNPNTMFTTGGVLATEGQKIVNWGNAVTGNNVIGASNATESEQPVLKVTAGGIKEVDFSGNSTAKLSFGQHPEIDWRNPNANFTVIMQSGDGNNGVYWISNLNSSNTENGSMGMDIYNNRLYYFNGSSWQHTSVGTTPTVSTVVTLIREQFPGVSQAYMNNVLINSTNTVEFANNTTTRDLLIGNTNNTTSLPYNGTFRRVLIWNRVLTPEEMTAVYNYLTS